MPKSFGIGLIAAAVADALVSHPILIGAAGNDAALTAVHQEFQKVKQLW